MKPFIWVMLWRETRSSWRHLLLFFLCIVAGVGGMVAVKSFGGSLNQAIHAEARTLMAADLVVRSNRPLPAVETQAVLALQAQGARITRSLRFVAMARGESGKTQLVDIRGVGAAYPFYGEVLTGSGQPLRALLNDQSVLVQKALLLRLGLKPGATLWIGEARFTIAGELVKEPDSPVSLFRLGPRVLMTDAGAESTGLVLPTSRIRHALLVSLPPHLNSAEVVTQLKKTLPERIARIDSYDEAQPRVNRFMGQLTDYLNMVGLVALLLGGIGVAGAIRVFLTRKFDSLAILKCLGAPSNLVLKVYLLQALLLGIAGSLAGAALGSAAQLVLPVLLKDLVPVNLEFHVSPLAVGEGLLLGALTTLWFTLGPLLAIRKVPPGRVFRRHAEPLTESRLLWRQRALSGGSAMVLVALLSWWQVGSLKVASIFFLGLCGTVLLLLLATWGLLWLLPRLPQPQAFALKQGLASLHRPGNQSGAVVVSLGLGVLLLLTIFLVQRNLLNEVAGNDRETQPNLFFIDIQKDQRGAFRQLLAKRGLEPQLLIPIVRGRVVALQGQTLRPDDIVDRHKRRVLGFEYSFTYRDQLLEGEEVLAGKFGAPAARSNLVPVSVADWWTDHTGLALGDRLTLDVQGLRLEAVITSIRRINWTNRRANFSFVFPGSVLRDAPQVFVSAVKVPDAASREALQGEVAAKLPNVSAIDAEQIIQLVQAIMDRIALVIQFMATFTVLVGLVILLGAVATTKYQRLREAVLLKTLGASRALVARVLAVEYMLLGGMAGLVGIVAAAAFTWGLVTLVFDGRWSASLPPYLIAFATALVLIALTGLASSADILLRKPLEVLREE